MKLLVSLALFAASTALAAQQVAKATPPAPTDSTPSPSSAPEPSAHPTRAVDAPKFLPGAAGAESSTSAEALLYAPVPRLAERKPVFSKKIFISELAAYTVPNILDGITTVRGVRRGFTESSWPRGSAELLGSRPGIARYTATMGGLETAVAFASYRMQHSQNRYLRLMGHSLMVEGAIDHTIGFASNLRLPSQPGH
jgi:hypothetical protein